MSEFVSILPPNRTRLEETLERAVSIVRPDLSPLPKLMNGETCPEHLLPWLAWALSVDVWDARWPVDLRRAAVSGAVSLHRQKGTRASVTRALAALGISVALSEWFEHGGAPFTFRVVAKPEIDLIGDATIPFLSLELRHQVARILDQVKPVRAHVDLSFLIAFTGQLAANGHARTRARSAARFNVSVFDRIHTSAVADTAAPRRRHVTFATLEVQ